MIDFEYNGITAQLPKRTLSIAKKMDEIDLYKNTSRERAAKSEFQFVFDILGKENTEKLLDGSTLDTVDTDEMDILYCEISRVYDAKAEEYNRRRESAIVDRPAVAAIHSMSEDVKSLREVTKK
ncbi:MAG: hypothetical protein LKJ90_08945 [Faecalibacterium sp.]|jgi:hypothetical protein|nr:hypothetical protein [Faecalibacterium sp.]